MFYLCIGELFTTVAHRHRSGSLGDLPQEEVDEGKVLVIIKFLTLRESHQSLFFLLVYNFHLADFGIRMRHDAVDAHLHGMGHHLHRGRIQLLHSGIHPYLIVGTVAVHQTIQLIVSRFFGQLYSLDRLSAQRHLLHNIPALEGESDGSRLLQVFAEMSIGIGGMTNRLH